MSTTVRARFAGGVLLPLEEVPLTEGEEVTLSILAPDTPPSGVAGVPRALGAPGDWLERTAGGWRDLIDAERLKREIYESRLVAARLEPRL